MMTNEHEQRLRKLAEQLKTKDGTGGNLEGVLAVALLEVLDELATMKRGPAKTKMSEFERKAIEDLVAVCERMDSFSTSDPEPFAALYWVKAILDPVRYAKDHPGFADVLLAGVEQPI